MEYKLQANKWRVSLCLSGCMLIRSKAILCKGVSQDDERKDHAHGDPRERYAEATKINYQLFARVVHAVENAEDVHAVLGAHAVGRRKRPFFQKMQICS